MKVIDFERKGNVVKLYLGDDEDTKYHGDDWNDCPYEHNAGTVYSEYVKKTVCIGFDFNYSVADPESDWRYNNNSPFCKDDFKAKKAPCIVIIKDPASWDVSYSEYIGSHAADCLKIYYEDNWDKLERAIKDFGGIIF